LLIARHVCLRDFDDRVPPPRARKPSEYPVKAAPSKAKSLVKRYRYEPYNLGTFPEDMMDRGGTSERCVATWRRSAALWLRRCLRFPSVSHLKWFYARSNVTAKARGWRLAG